VKRVEELISGPIFLTEMIKNGWQTSIRGEERKEEEKNIFLIYTPKTKLQFSLSRANYTTNKRSGFRSNLKDDV
jgi:hypothetical protein